MNEDSSTNWPRHIDLNRANENAQVTPQVDFAGTHLLIDCWQASRLDDIAHIETALREAVTVSGATLLHIHLHHFTPNGGVSGVAVLAESHISIHTWPERGYAALDVFMCGDTYPQLTVAVFASAFGTRDIRLSTHHRGGSTSQSSLNPTSGLANAS